MKKLNVTEIFESIQGEGKYVGYPALFIRLSGCNRDCNFCDTKYHIKGKQYSIEKLYKIIKDSKLYHVIFTGGEPLLQKQTLRELLNLFRRGEKIFHIETNGDLLETADTYFFSDITISPKDGKFLKRIMDNIRKPYSQKTSIKVVTDGTNFNFNLIRFADYLMPLTTQDKKENKKIQQRVWDLCIKKNKRYSPRLHVDVWNNKKGV